MTSPPAATTSARDRLIVALDFPTARQALGLVEKLGQEVRFYKVGLELFTAEGPSVVEDLTSAGFNVFLDLKLHDIPNTVAGAVQSAAQLGVAMLTVHALGGSRMMAAAVEAARSASHPPLILGVTVLTSLDKVQLVEIGLAAAPANQVLKLAELARAAGCEGVVASPGEVADLRRKLGPKLAIVTPGVRPVAADAGDQLRIATPAEAIRAGASHLVVGRPITQAPDPVGAAQAILAEMESVLKNQKPVG